MANFLFFKNIRSCKKIKLEKDARTSPICLSKHNQYLKHPKLTSIARLVQREIDLGVVPKTGGGATHIQWNFKPQHKVGSFSWLMTRGRRIPTDFLCSPLRQVWTFLSVKLVADLKKIHRCYIKFGHYMKLTHDQKLLLVSKKQQFLLANSNSPQGP